MECYFGHGDCEEIATTYVKEWVWHDRYIERPACEPCATAEARDLERRAESQDERNFHRYHAGLGPPSWYR